MIEIPYLHNKEYYFCRMDAICMIGTGKFITIALPIEIDNYLHFSPTREIKVYLRTMTKAQKNSATRLKNLILIYN